MIANDRPRDRRGFCVALKVAAVQDVDDFFDHSPIPVPSTLVSAWLSLIIGSETGSGIAMLRTALVFPPVGSSGYTIGGLFSPSMVANNPDRLYGAIGVVSQRA